MNHPSSHLLTLVVDNEFGVLTRITSTIRREGWNIKSLSVAETADHTLSRLTLSLECFDATVGSVLQRLGRLDCVHEICACTEETHLLRELALLRLPKEELSRAKELGGLPAGPGVYEFSGTPAQLDAVICALSPLEVTRTGVVAVNRSELLEERS